jgi:hypothetical protein
MRLFGGNKIGNLIFWLFSYLEFLNILNDYCHISTPSCVNANGKIKNPKENTAFINGN